MPYFQRLQTLRLGSLLLALTPVSVAFAGDFPRINANSNQALAGHLEHGVLKIQLETAVGNWYPEEDDGPAFQVAAFRETGSPLLTPGPLIRVPEGTEIRASVHNRLDQPLTLHGFHARPGDAKNVVVIASDETRELVFQAGAPGTYLYWGSRTAAETLAHRRTEDDQLNGALVVDPKGYVATVEDRTMVISQFVTVYDEVSKPPKFHDVLGINGHSWPHTERLTYRVGQTVRWRVINATRIIHPMHLHGFYFRVDSVGDGETDTIYGEDERRQAVTELLRPGHTFSLTWTPERSGNWVFHCHVLPHISPESRFWQTASETTGHSAADHAQEGMAGLVMEITVLPSNTSSRPSAKPAAPVRNLELVASEIPGKFGTDPGMAFAIPNAADGKLEPKIPGPPLVLTQGQPAAIRVVNRLPEPLAVHWHGIELESFFDGVPGISGSGTQLMPSIAAGESFVARFTPPRAGTFIYHTHIDDVKQLSSGLYGPLIVLPPGQTFDPESDRVLVLSKAGPGVTPLWLNGSAAPDLGSFRVGRTYRVRIINILPENPPVDLALLAAGTPVTWRPLAKDGADLPSGQRAPRPAKVTIAIGETYDFEFRPETAGELTLEGVRPQSVFPAEITPSNKPVVLRPESRIAAKIEVK
jgi:FtsP/CotA-like multicopper oxidase with cupredoxin domain